MGPVDRHAPPTRRKPAGWSSLSTLTYRLELLMVGFLNESISNWSLAPHLIGPRWYCAKWRPVICSNHLLRCMSPVMAHLRHH